MRKFQFSLVLAASMSIVSAVQAQVVLRGVADNRSGNVSAFANAPSGDPRESGFNVDPGQNDFDPFGFDLFEMDTRQGCSATQARASVSHDSQFINIDGQQRCRGFRAAHAASDTVTVTACGAGQTSSANFEGNLNVVVRIENAPAGGTPIRVRATSAGSGGASSLVRIVRPNGTLLLNLTTGAVNTAVNLPNGEYTIQGSTSNGFVSRSTIGTSSRTANFSIGFWKECQGDLNGDGAIDLADLSELLSAFGVNNQGDLTGDSETDIGDLALLLARFGTSCNN